MLKYTFTLPSFVIILTLKGTNWWSKRTKGFLKNIDKQNKYSSENKIENISTM